MDLEPRQHLHLDSDPDRLFEAQSKYPIPFEFNQEVARVFDDMINRSVPHYQQATLTAMELAKRFYQEGTAIVDIGCSTGTTLELIASALTRQNQKANLIGIDTSQPMVEKAKSKMNRWQDRHEANLICGSIENVPLPPTSMVIMNYTLQFIPVMQRRSILEKIFRSLEPGGLLFLGEKVRSRHPGIQEVTTLQYERFKEEAGYSRTEIERKKEALDNVLVSVPLDELLDTLKNIGFSYREPILRWHNFTSIVAIK